METGYVRIESHFMGISAGTELNTYRGGVNWHSGRDPKTRLFYPDADQQQWEYPATLGYANIGRVVEVAPDVTNLSVGDMVFCNAGHCTPVRYRANQVWRVPKEVDPRACTFIQLVRTALNVVQHARLSLGDTVVVFGLGVVGLLTLQLARLNGAQRIIAFDPIAKRREMALRFGAHAALDPTNTDPGNVVRELNDGRGADVAIECSANIVALQQCTRAVGELGRVVLASMPNHPAPFHFGMEMHFNAVTIHGANVMKMLPELGPLWDMERRDAVARQLLTTMDLLPLITHEFKFADAANAYDFLDKSPQDVIGAIFRCPAAEKS
jgi:threonine dehydrogenase-like Zn-dependent dehydrogenase